MTQHTGNCIDANTDDHAGFAMVECICKRIQHTPGPWHVGGDDDAHIRDSDEYTVVRVSLDDDSEQAQANARLIAAAVSSYDKHCGQRAIECAEGDLLGNLLAVCKGAMGYLASLPIAYRPDDRWFKPMSEAIAKAEGRE